MASILLCAVAVAQSRRGQGGGAALSESCCWVAWVGRCDGGGAVSGPQRGCVVAVEFGEVVTHHD
jgi:hypothetical protein